ncbi:Mpv17/PMP22 family protein [Aspergillus mulundensis]|uniref:Uncharacterized protein n=1 Tax=Aspergillus mulundensis TaxID=1810919 RepID=A0A3D8SUV4_9EURO|nr:Uncharacterized protein DSM5745_01736 [Aspergillus mulundensis]RDW89961.1 Uncharacterized protein DSM5745_01736 [Aspergillus mulundensis]
MRPSFFLRRPTFTPSRSSASPRLRTKRYESTSPPPSKPDHGPTPKSEPPASSPTPAQSHNSIPPTPPPGASPTVPARSESRSLGHIIRASPLGRMGRSYSRFQEKRPYTTQICSSIVIYLCGDLSAQFFFPPEAPAQKVAEPGREDSGEVAEEKGGYDPWRTMRHLTVGIGSSIPSYNWFMFLHNNFNFTSKFLSIVTKVVVQQAVFTPVFNTYFFSVHSLLSGASLEETWERLKVALPRSIVNSAKFWPMVTAFSFMYVPPQFRNVFSGCIAVGWQTYLSWLNQKAAREVETALTEPASSEAQVGEAAKAVIKA